MIRERRTRDKLQLYYQKYRDQGIIDPNVHPWVAEAWQKSHSAGVPMKGFGPFKKLATPEWEARRDASRFVLEQMNSLYDSLRDFLSRNNISLMLLDADFCVLKSFSMSYYQKTPGELEAVFLGEKEIGASSLGIALAHRTPFFLYGPEIWIEDCHDSDAAAAPIMRDGAVRYLLSMVVMDGAEKQGLAMENLLAVLLAAKHSLEQALKLQDMLQSRNEALDRIPMVVYQVGEDGSVLYANDAGAQRLLRSKKAKDPNRLPKLPDVVLNYKHTLIPKAFLGVPSHNKELVWLIGNKTYEDLADIRPVYRDGEIHSAMVISAPIEEIKTMLAYASQYKSRYSLSSLVGDSPRFASMKEKATRCARNLSYLLIIGEPGTGKQRLAHGIHQASPAAAGPLITIRCGDVPTELLPGELFGYTDARGEAIPGKIELARGGTLFIDEVDKLGEEMGDRLQAALKQEKTVRVIAAADVDPKRLVAKGIFAEKLYHLIADSLIRTPSLRHRQADIPLITADILRELAEQNSMEPKKLSPAALELLLGFDWPGNVKQLQEVLEQGFFQAQGLTIMPMDIVLPGGSGWGKTWKRDRNAFMDAWKACGGNISRLATNLGVSRVTLYRYLEKYGLDKARK